ncbi:alpha/beta fold hydrolase [Telluria beijingensis]|uniref:alpha/beta fold hydrolase n=1 Tax=Telluria beijingensis TaxID=3068633 RepID=UPI002795D129|nr:alpha/beta fold hydrolase [Massilia sp. REN29]
MTPTLLFLPGTLCDRRVWEPCAALLEARWPCVHVDYRHETSIAAMARTCLEAAAGPLVPVGLSMGGIVALEMWRQAPERLAALALFDTNPGPDLAERGARRGDQLRRAREGGLADIALHELAPAYFTGRAPDPALPALVVSMALEQNAASYAAQSMALATRPDSWPLLAGIARPVLLACGEHDRICPPEQHDRMAELLPRWTWSPIRDAGHLAPLEQPQSSALALQSWLQLCFPPEAGPAPSPF